jgi:hypothetical protein
MLNPDQVEMVGDRVSIQESHFEVHNLSASARDNQSAGWHDKIHRVVLRASVTSCLDNPETPPYLIGQNVLRLLLGGKDTAV